MKYAIVENNVVLNVAVADEPQGNNWVEIADGVSVSKGFVQDGDTFTNPNLATEARQLRNFRLETEVDPIASNALRWNALTDPQRAAWTQYRTDLLNVPQQAGFPNSVTWPTKPE